MTKLLILILASFFFFANLLNSQSLAPKNQIVSEENAIILRHIASLRDSLTRIRMASFENLSINDQNKTAGIINELLNRSEQNIYNLLPKGRFEWSWTGFDQPHKMVAHAEELINSLSLGKDPFAGKYSEPGGYVVDHALIKRGDVHHLIYIRGTAVTNWPEYPLFNFGHAVSPDLINWTIKDPVLQCSEKGWDQYQVWAPYILQWKGLYYMFYTGVNDSACQAICLATSPDLYAWKRSESNPQITSGPWGLWDPNKWSDCRDPVILKDGKTFYCYYTAARMNTENGQRENCIGISSSKDLMTWKDEGFIRLTNSLSTPPESPFVLKRNDTYYMFYTSYKYGTVYLTSKNPVTGWQELPVENMVLLSGISASEIYQDENKWYISYISHQKNGLHFFEIKEMVWNEDESISILD